MKRTVLFLLVICIVCAGAFAQETLYVSANGSGLGWEETDPTSFTNAWVYIEMGFAKKLIIIGTLDINNTNQDRQAVFDLFDANEGLRAMGGEGYRDALGEILITGKPNASGTERAVLSANGTGKSAVRLRYLKIRFEHIEISGGEKDDGFGCGIEIYNDSNVILGQGAVVRNNQWGIGIIRGTCIIDGGEVRDNKKLGIAVDENGILTMQSGAIRDNRGEGNGGGVYVGSGGRFTMTGGTITGNSATDGGGVFVRPDGRFTMTGGTITGNRATRYGGGVCVYGRFDQTGGTITNNSADEYGGGVIVRSGGRFDQTSGTISNNTAGRGSNPNVYRETGSLGSNLTPGSSSSSSSSSSTSSSSGSSSSGSSSRTTPARSSSSSGDFKFSVPLYLGFYLQGLNQNIFSIGLPLQLGMEFDFGSAVSFALLGEATAGLGWPRLFEYSFGGVAELYFLNKKIGLGGGIGTQTSFLNWESLGDSDSDIKEYPEVVKSFYTRFALFYRTETKIKISLYAQHYFSDPLNGFGNWGFGFAYYSKMF
jgi:hypothetical protein